MERVREGPKLVRTKTLNPAFEIGENGEVLLPELSRDNSGKETILIVKVVESPPMKPSRWERVSDSVLIALLTVAFTLGAQQVVAKSDIISNKFNALLATLPAI